jgi:hypothetical protein
LTKAAFGALNGVVAFVAQSVAFAPMLMFCQPAGNVGGVTPSNFSLSPAALAAGTWTAAAAIVAKAVSLRNDRVIGSST